MVHFQEISVTTFLRDYWQKKPLVIRQALPGFINPLTPEELAGLALEDDIESRIVEETAGRTPQWHLKHGPFREADFNSLPDSHWTLLVQGVDRLIPEVYDALNHFDFIPQWRVDDVMISFATQGGSVGPHYDNYDVFLYQAQGRREWALTTQKCTPENYLSDLELRIMDEFAVEERFILEEGDMLYLPPHVGHYGISLSDECMTYSFGYRSYQGQELLDSLAEYVAEQDGFKQLYQDPDWSGLTHTSELTKPAWQNAQDLLRGLIHDERLMKSWFGCFATRLDQSTEQQLPVPLADDELSEVTEFIDHLKQGLGLERDACCRFAYQVADEQDEFHLYINGCLWETDGVTPDLLSLVANTRYLEPELLSPYLDTAANQHFLYDLWTLQWLLLPED